ncbi:MAG: hypothetical protein K2X71_01250 [Methylobacterium sp.]|uniref:hypothetical protein n=1 Tax=Methylobacterium sp. TaxID=409 RepID=UPI0025863DE9|nr:hypothetical protein [Methylobacterium sp.]MBY0294657.1 hypothetical protein [Methylobacterium sp.]
MPRPLRLAAAAAAALVLSAPVLAADVDEPPPRFDARPGWVPPRVVRPAETCRVFVKRRIDPYGDEVVRRVRVCEEGPAFDGPPRWRGPGGGADEDGPPRPRFGPPRPPADIPEDW